MDVRRRWSEKEQESSEEGEGASPKAERPKPTKKEAGTGDGRARSRPAEEEADVGAASLEELSAGIEEAAERVEKRVSGISRRARMGGVLRHVAALVLAGGLAAAVIVMTDPVTAALAMPPALGLLLPLFKLEGFAAQVERFREFSADWWWFGRLGEWTDGIEDIGRRSGVRTTLYLYSVEAVPLLLYLLFLLLVGALMLVLGLFVLGMLLQAATE